MTIELRPHRASGALLEIKEMRTLKHQKEEGRLGNSYLPSLISLWTLNHQERTLVHCALLQKLRKEKYITELTSG
ncbi:hypothetical protein I79_000689 [Cricetulus griseus]|uniref:Uncharacterized protein n=1 Tax=Cricetulus griseus TaxID=10029 RepID=G3GSS1_CRIGR|nr:hypothetical protein I79_000689 [Cricetulus griseus]